MSHASTLPHSSSQRVIIAVPCDCTFSDPSALEELVLHLQLFSAVEVGTSARSTVISCSEKLALRHQLITTVEELRVLAFSFT
jgi:hypothetical protein